MANYFFTTQKAVNNMKKIVRAIRVDIARALFSGRFLLSIILLLGWMLFNSSHYLFDESLRADLSAANILHYATTDSVNLALLLLPIATIPYSGSYNLDYDSNFLNQAIGRVGLRAYSFSKFFVTALSSFLSAIISMVIFLFILYLLGFKFLACTIDTGGYTILAVKGLPILYYFVRFMITGLTCSLAAVFSLMISAYVSNSYVCLMAPLVGYYLSVILLSILMDIFPALWSLLSLFNLSYNFFYQLSDDFLTFSITWTIVYLTTLTALFGICFNWRLRREYAQ